MTRRNAVTAVRAAGLLLLVSASSARLSAQSASDWAPGDYLVQALARVHLGALAAQTQSLGYDSDLSVLGALVRRGQTVSLARPLRHGEQYILIATGDHSARDVDLEVLDSNGRVVARDTGDEPVAVVKYRPAADGKYSLRVSLVSTRPAAGAHASHSLCALAVLSAGGWDVPLTNLDRAVARLVEFGGLIATRFDSQFLAERNQWAVFGGVLDAGRSSTLTNVTLGEGLRAILAAADTDSGDVDLSLLSADGSVLAKDDRYSADAALTQYTSRGESYGIRITNAAATPRFVLAGVVSAARRVGQGPALLLEPLQPVATLVGVHRD